MQLALIDVPGPGALENATPPEVFAGAAPAIGRTFRVVEEVSGGGRAGAAETADERQQAGDGKFSRSAVLAPAREDDGAGRRVAADMSASLRLDRIENSEAAE
jgi:hypothetical protein